MARSNLPSVPAGLRDPSAREGLLAALARGRSVAVTGWAGSGLTDLLARVRIQHEAAGHFVVTAAAAPAHQRPGRPFSYLLGLGAGWASPTADLTPSDLPDLVEQLACALAAAADGRPVTVLLDDLHAADPASLAALPLLTRRADTSVVAAARSVRSGVHPRALTAAAIQRLDVDARLHLEPLDRPEITTVIKTIDPRATAGRVDALLTALGTASGQPGLARAAWATLQLPPRHPLVAELSQGQGRRSGAVIAAAHLSAGLLAEDLDVIAGALGCTGDDIAHTVDDVTAQGWLTAATAGCWQASVPALAQTLAQVCIPDGLRAVLAGQGAARRPAVPRPTSRGRGGGRGRHGLLIRAQVMTLIGKGLSNGRIAVALGLSEKTVEGYVSALLKEHGAANRTQLVTQLHLTGNQPVMT